jgi:hypothetical protein
MAHHKAIVWKVIIAAAIKRNKVCCMWIEYGLLTNPGTHGWTHTPFAHAVQNTEQSTLYTLRQPTCYTQQATEKCLATPAAI